MRLVQRWLLALLCALVLPTKAQTVEYIHTDALGTPVAVTDVSRNVIERSEYEPYGERLTTSTPSTDKDGPGYTGHVKDASTGLNYMQQRYYDPAIGRFLSVDPVTADGHTGGNFNRYWYANNSPYKYIDPDGRYGFDRNTRRFIIPGGSFKDLELESGAYNFSGGTSRRQPGNWRKSFFETVTGLSRKEVIGTSDTWVSSKFDKLYGLEKRFWQWYHRQNKRKGDPDISTRDEAVKLHDEWEKRGRPGPNSKRGRSRDQDGSASAELLEFAIPWQIMPGAISCAELDCDDNGEMDMAEKNNPKDNP